ncbi:high mobility group box domain-containing protein [Chytridium lagenaria]|nr:high mobility group box domain-containing protein [Chytridium lagenaria]
MPKAKSTKVSSRKKKDPNAPKKPMSPYLIWSNENRARIKEENPDAGFGDIGKLLGAEWKQVGESEKEAYKKMADKDKARYEKEVKTYKSAAAEEEDDEEEDD